MNMSRCQENYIADYLQIFFDCVPHDVTGPVGFTAHVPNNMNVVTYEVIGFTEVVSNFGGHFNPATSSFVCPDHGVYMFSMTICTFADYLTVILYRNNRMLIYGYPDDFS